MQKRNTPQRQLVLTALNTLRTHATAEDVYAEVSKQYKNISLATVYRNLKSLSADGEVKKISVPDGADRFDFQTHEHYHLLCKACGRFEDAPVEYLGDLQRYVAKKSGYRIDSYDIVFIGKCPACQLREEQEGKAAQAGDGASAAG